MQPYLLSPNINKQNQNVWNSNKILDFGLEQE